MFAPILGILRVVPIWAWALIAVLAWGGFQKHRATSATKAAAAAEQRAAVEEATAKAEAATRQIEHQLATEVEEAANAYRANLAISQRAAAAARSELERLRLAIARDAQASTARPGASAASGADGAPAVHTVLGECAGALQAMGELATQDARRLEGLQDYVKRTDAAKAPQPKKD